MRKRKPFNWSALDRNALYAMLLRAGPQIVGKDLPVKELHAIIAKQIKQHLPIRVKFSRKADIDQGRVYLGAFYYSEADRDGGRQIQLVFSYHVFDHSLTLSQHRFKRLCILFADTVLHEIIHMRQFRARNFKEIPGYESTAAKSKLRKDQEYYGNNDEIGAYAFNIACELYDQFGTDYRAAFDFIDSLKCLKRKRQTINRYLIAFDKNPNHKILQKLKKKIAYYLPYAALGKPFKTSDHLTF